MKPEEAIKNLKLMQAAIEWEYPMDYAATIDAAIEALENQAAAQKMLEVEKAKYIYKWHRPDLSRGRISAFYDALGINYSD